VSYTIKVGIVCDAKQLLVGVNKMGKSS